MNQILKGNQENAEINPDLEIKKKKNTNATFKKYFKLLFSISLFGFFSLFITLIYQQFSLFQQEKLSHKLVENYSLLRLYSSQTNHIGNTSPIDSNILGTIEIPKINISYPIFSSLTDEFLKIAPCRFYGEMPNQMSNLCIAGHNYDNEKFFSHIVSLKPGDTIFIIDSQNNQFTYFVSEQYEVKDNDLSPIYEEPKNTPLLTLVTCNNLTKNRIIVKAKLENF